jgi:hypothetical protein
MYLVSTQTYKVDYYTTEIETCIWSHRYVSHDQMIKNVTHLPILALVFYPITTYQGHFIVLFHKLNMFFHEKLNMDRKFYCYYVANVDVLAYRVFYHTKTTSDMETDFL